MTIIISAILAVVTGLFGPPVNDPETSVDAMNTCAYEDGSDSALPCVWDATKHGNGHGQSFVIYSDGTYHYFS